MYYGRNCSSSPIPCVRLGSYDWILAYGRWVSVMQAGVRGSLLRHFLLSSHLLLLGHTTLETIVQMVELQDGGGLLNMLQALTDWQAHLLC